MKNVQSIVAVSTLITVLGFTALSEENVNVEMVNEMANQWCQIMRSGFLKEMRELEAKVKVERRLAEEKIAQLQKIVYPKIREKVTLLREAPDFLTGPLLQFYALGSEGLKAKIRGNSELQKDKEDLQAHSDAFIALALDKVIKEAFVKVAPSFGMTSQETIESEYGKYVAGRTKMPEKSSIDKSEDSLRGERILYFFTVADINNTSAARYEGKWKSNPTAPETDVQVARTRMVTLKLKDGSLVLEVVGTFPFNEEAHEFTHSTDLFTGKETTNHMIPKTKLEAKLEAVKNSVRSCEVLLKAQPKTESTTDRILFPRREKNGKSDSSAPKEEGRTRAF